MAAIVAKLRGLVASFRQDEVISARNRIQRRQALTAALRSRLTLIRTLLYVGGFLWLLALPSSYLGRGIYIDENALSPGQVDTYWNWDDVRHADQYLDQIEALRNQNASSSERAHYFLKEFQKMGVPSEIQSYSFNVRKKVSGNNIYAISSSPRSSGTEAMVISAPWLSHSGVDTVNVRGLAMVLALARFLKKYSLWAKDLIFIISDGSLDGMHAFLSSYHGAIPSNLRADSLNITSGSIWTALNIDYPGHSFAEIGIFHEGINGRLPNQDLINSVTFISQWDVRASVTLYDTTVQSIPLQSLSKWIPNNMHEYLRRARNILRHASYQGRGKASGVHGLFHQYRIDAFTMYAIPDVGPHGFYSLGRIIESAMRTANNLLERLHASFFFYIFTTSRTFLKVGHYLPAVIMISVSHMFGALDYWVEAGWVYCEIAGDHKPNATSQKHWVRRGRPVFGVLWRMAVMHAAGYVLWFVSALRSRFPASTLIGTSIILVLGDVELKPASSSERVAQSHWLTLKSCTLILASSIMSITTLLNFSLSAILAVGFFPLVLVRPNARQYGVILCLVVDVLTSAVRSTDAPYQWQMFGVWFEPLYYLLFVPLIFDAALVTAMPAVTN